MKYVHITVDYPFIIHNQKNMEQEEIMQDNGEERGEEDTETKPQIKVKDNLEVVTKKLDAREKSFNEEHGADYNSMK